MSIYQNLIDLLTTYVYGGSIQPGSFEELVCILIATLGCLFLVSLPFLIVYKIICFMTGR